MKEANLIGGEWVGADSGETIDVTNPATGELIGTVPNAGDVETRRAIDAADAAFDGLAGMALMERVGLLMKMHDALMDNQKTLAELLTVEMGKPMAESMGEIGIGAAYVRWFAEVAPALAIGCTVVAKPATATPYSGLAWGALAQEAGFPAGAVNVVTGSARKIGGAIMDDARVRKVTFTGSTEVGKELIRQSAGTVKKVSMELGGNAPFLVFDDADVDKAVQGAMVSKFRNSGQTCVCANRIYVQAGVYDAFVEKLTAATAAMKVGNGLEDGVEQGPMIDMDAVAKVEEFISDATSKGGTVAHGGKRHDKGQSFFEPTIITGATQDMMFAKEEIFGPIAPVFKFEDEDEAIGWANDTEFGLASYAYTRDVGRIFKLTEKLQYGMIGINSGLITTVEAPFGGVKESGLGKEGGSQGLEDYMETKYTAIDF